MPGSDDFGYDDDDTLFIAAATQAEASQHGGGFETSPRPTKRRRVRGPAQVDGASSDEVERSETDEEGHSPAKEQSRHFQSTAAPSQEDEGVGLPEIDEEYYFPGELPDEDGNGEKSAKNSKYKIAVPRNGGYFEDRIFTQTQAHLDSSPSEFRGAVWKRPKPAPPPPPLFEAAQANGPNGRAAGKVNGAGPSAANALRQGTLNGFGRPAPINGMRNQPVDGDAALAQRLQAEEDRLSRRAQTAVQTNRYFSNGPANLPEELADLPSDAFSSSSPEKSPTKEVMELSSQVTASQARTNGLRGPQQGLKQMTIFGQAATQEMTATQAAKKKHAWPLKSRDEPPTHHKLDEASMKTWVYPTNLGTIRDYQYNIVSRSLFHNTLVALPTGLGKTFIAATIMLNFYRWTKDAQIIFMAPTKPLIAQQMEACYHNVGIPRKDTVLMTGETQPAIRHEQWMEKRVFFMTPQTVINDLKTGSCDPKKIVLLVVDEAHKSTGGYAYTEVIKFTRRFNTSFRVLALTATPGGTVEAVQQVINALSIARVELRTEQSLDIRPYTHEKQTDMQLFDLSDEQELIMDHLSKTLQPALNKLCSQNAYWSRDPMKLTAYGLTTARQKWAKSDAGRNAPQGVKFMLNAVFTVLSQIAHGINLLKNHGIGPFYSSINEFQRKVTSGETKGKNATEIVQSEDFTKMTGLIRAWTNNPDFIGHPKLEYLREIVLSHFLDTGEGMQGSNVPPSATRVMVFASYRDSTEEICRVLKRNEPMIRPQVFVGQAASKNSEGMNQKKQNEVIQDFKAGKYNTLVATSIGEEGLDIGDVDLIVNYDASASPIRMLQRIGRTGRKRMGRVVLLMMRGKEEADYNKAKDNYVFIQKSIADAGNYEYRDNESPRILPKEVQPVVDRRVVDIPVENSQPLDLNERKRRAKGGKIAKRPAKKFHMPDNVRTGFVKASKMDSDSDQSDEQPARKRKMPAKKTAAAKAKAVVAEPQPDPVQVPQLGDVLLTDAQEQEHESKYARLAGGDDDALIRSPDPAAYPQSLVNAGPTKYVCHGRATKVLERTMKAVHAVDDARIQAMKAALDPAFLRLPGVGSSRLVDPVPEHQEPAKIEAPVAKAKPAARGRPRKDQPAQRTTSFQSAATTDTVEPPSPTPPPARAKAKPGPKLKARPGPKPKSKPAPSSPKPRGRTRKKAQHTTSVNPDMAGEGDESSPEPTPADMRIRSQGIDLGSVDTSGEDEEEGVMDSELEGFLARSDEIEMASSSQRLPDDTQPPARRKVGRKLARGKQKQKVVLSDIGEDQSESEGNASVRDEGLGGDEENDPGLAAMMEEDDDDGNGASSGVEEMDVPAASEKGKKHSVVRKRRVVDSESDE